MNDLEREAVILNAAWSMIDEMVNWAMFVKVERTEPTNLMFQTRQCARLFLILLGDFLSDVRAFKGEPPPLGLKPAPSNAALSDLTFLFHLRQVGKNPLLGSNPGPLNAVIEDFGGWLETSFKAEGVNLHAIDVVADLTVTRFRYLKMCGDIAKHNLARLATNAKHLRQLLVDAGYDVTEAKSYLALETFSEWFADGVFIYQSSQIAEFLNNLRWAIYDYVQPQFRRAFRWRPDIAVDPPMYDFRVPDGLEDPLAQAMYFELMQRSRREPYVRRFVVHPTMKMRY